MFRALIAASFLSLTACASAASPEGQVQTAQGVVKGVTEDGLTKYLGLEYAKAKRWELPKEVASWDGVKSLDTFGPACPQDGQEVMIEDCLFLNIFTPKGTSAKDNLPVMVWFHGGGFRAGAGGDSPKNFAREDVIIVTFNYRLGVLGFRDWPGWTENDPRNFGQGDMVKALEWVNENIESFGGDKDNVTLAGHSAGGMGVQLMMADPRAKGLFARAISHAGYGAWPFPKAYNPSDEERIRIRYGGLEFDASPEALVAKTPYYHLPFIEGSDLPRQPVEVFKSGDQAAVPYIAGANSYDGYGTLQGAGFNPRSFAARYIGQDGISAVYDEDIKASSDQFAMRLFGDMRYVLASWQTARYMQNINQPGYLFYYDAASEGLPGARHGAQYEVLFGQGGSALKSYYLNFIKTGSPNGQTLPQWSPYGGSDLEWMVFDPEPMSQPSDLTKRMRLLETLDFPN